MWKLQRWTGKPFAFWLIDQIHDEDSGSDCDAPSIGDRAASVLLLFISVVIAVWVLLIR